MKKKYDHLKVRLEAEKAHLLAERGQIESNSHISEARREGSPFGKREEEATESLELEKRLAMENKIQENLAEIDHALQKMEEGTYGICDICGKPIAPERLEALPAATQCVECKAKSARGKVGAG